MFLLYKALGLFKLQIDCLQAQKRLSTNIPSQASATTGELTSTETSKLDVLSDKDRVTLLVENDAAPSSKLMPQTVAEQQQNIGKDVSSITSSERPSNEVVKDDADHDKVPVTAVDADVTTSASNGDTVNEKASDVPVECPPSPSPAKEIEVLDEDRQDHPIDAEIKLRDADVSSNTDQERSQSAITDPPVNGETSLKDADLSAEPLVDQLNQQHQYKADTSPMKVQEQLDEVNCLVWGSCTTIARGYSNLKHLVSKFF